MLLKVAALKSDDKARLLELDHQLFFPNIPPLDLDSAVKYLTLHGLVEPLEKRDRRLAALQQYNNEINRYDPF